MEYIYETHPQSISIDYADYILLEKGECIYGWYGTTPIFKATEQTLVVADELIDREGYLIAKSIRYQMPIQGRGYALVGPRNITPDVSPRLIWGDNHRQVREICRQRGASVAYFAGQIEPVCHEDEYLVPDFNMSGCYYFVVPEHIAKDFGWV